jgi:hypothetical protein
MLHRPKARLVAVAAAAGTVCALAAAGTAMAGPTPPWSTHNPAIPNAFTNTTPGLAQIALTGRNIPGVFITWKGQYDSRVHYKFRISGTWSTSEVIPDAFTNTSPAAAFYTDLKGKDAELVVWKTVGRGGLSKIEYSQGVTSSNGTINWTKPTVLPGGSLAETSTSPSVLFPLNATHPRVIVAWRGPFDHVRYEIGTEAGPYGRAFTWGTKKTKSSWISAGSTTDPTTTSAAPALTEILSGGNGTVYVFWKGDSATAPIDYATTPDNAGTGLAGNATIPWTLQGSVPTGLTTLAATTAGPAVSSANVHSTGPLLLAYKGPSGFYIRYQTLTGTTWSEPYAFVNGQNNTTADAPALVNGTLANVARTTSGLIYLHHYNG